MRLQLKAQHVPIYEEGAEEEEKHIYASYRYLSLDACAGRHVNDLGAAFLASGVRYEVFHSTYLCMYYTISKTFRMALYIIMDGGLLR